MFLRALPGNRLESLHLTCRGEVHRDTDGFQQRHAARDEVIVTLETHCDAPFALTSLFSAHTRLVVGLRI